MKKPSSTKFVTGLVALSLAASCSKKASEAAETVVAATTESTTQANALALAYPGSLALSMFPSTSTSLLADEVATDTYKEKVADADKRLRGEGDCFVASQIAERTAKNSTVTCYEFDSDMNPATFTGGPGGSVTTGTVDGTDGAGQACMVTFAKDQVQDVTAKVDRALAVVQGLLCVAKKDAEAKGTELAEIVPGAAPIEMATIVNAGLPTDSPITFNKADMSAVTNADGSITYVTQVEIKNPFGKVDSITLNHTPAVGAVAENGVLSFVREPLGSSTPNYNPNDAQKDFEKSDVMAISYKNTVATDGTKAVIAELNQARIHSTYAALNEDGLINFAAIPASASNDKISSIKYVSFDINPDTGAGNLSYWMNPGGNLVESARGFLFNITAGTTGLLSGCGVSGATSDVSIRGVNANNALVLAPTRYWHPRDNQNTNVNKDARYTANEGPSVTKQCFVQAASGLYEIDKALTTSTQGYDIIAGTDTSVRAPARPPEREALPPPPAK